MHKYVSVSFSAGLRLEAIGTHFDELEFGTEYSVSGGERWFFFF